MRVLLLSDIHANLEALNAVLASAPPHERVWNLGDVVGYGANPNEVIDRVREASAAGARGGSVFVRGNHDKVCSGVEGVEQFNAIAARAARWTRSVLTPERAEWLRQLPSGPISADDPEVSCVHGSPLDEDEYLLTLRHARLPLTRAEARINFFGHTHIQGGFATNGEEWFRLVSQCCARGADEYELPLRANARYLINPGSVGQPRDGDWRAAFALYETEQSGDNAATRRVTFYRVPYDVTQAQQKILAAGLPDRLATRLRDGR
jgi:diadenosine tetraphosphatase ApaH/serine/threonine PP2A family protein phosphatase